MNCERDIMTRLTWIASDASRLMRGSPQGYTASAASHNFQSEAGSKLAIRDLHALIRRVGHFAPPISDNYYEWWRASGRLWRDIANIAVLLGVERYFLDLCASQRMPYTPPDVVRRCRERRERRMRRKLPAKVRRYWRDNQPGGGTFARRPGRMYGDHIDQMLDDREALMRGDRVY